MDESEQWRQLRLGRRHVARISHVSLASNCATLVTSRGGSVLKVPGPLRHLPRPSHVPPRPVPKRTVHFAGPVAWPGLAGGGIGGLRGDEVLGSIGDGLILAPSTTSPLNRPPWGTSLPSQGERPFLPWHVLSCPLLCLDPIIVVAPFAVEALSFLHLSLFIPSRSLTRAHAHSHSRSILYVLS